jgi:hypothetical protein
MGVDVADGYNEYFPTYEHLAQEQSTPARKPPSAHEDFSRELRTEMNISGEI